MKTYHLPILLLAAMCAVAMAQPTPAPPVAAVFPKQPAPGFTSACRITRVIDGDTIAVEVTQTFHVRFLQCWAPESRTTNLEEKRRGLASKEHLQNLVDEEDRAMLFVPLSGNLTEAMTLGRVLGHVWRKGDEKSLSQQQIEGGFATPTK